MLYRFLGNSELWELIFEALFFKYDLEKYRISNFIGNLASRIYYLIRALNLKKFWKS